MSSGKLSYRPEIDGLRAIAVVSVLLYHAEFILFGRDWFQGGFVGVDIFFVISGYLITRIIMSELQKTGKFSFLHFYERRTRRIMPVLFVVIVATIPFAWRLLLPSAFVEYATSILTSIFFSSNFFFYFSTTEYGADSALLKPFLHTWSLGVEEQFYLLFPVIAIIGFKFFRKQFLSVIFLLSLASLQFAQFMEVRNHDLNFFLPFSRFWELAAGTVLAYRELNYTPSKDSLLNKLLPTLGFGLLMYSLFSFNHETPHPSYVTLIPIIGVSLIIGFSSTDEFIGKILSFKPIVAIGLISYSGYLWHFPIFAFGRIAFEDPTNLHKVIWIALTVVLSIATYYLVETPFRSSKFIKPVPFTILTTSAFAVLVVLAFASIQYFEPEKTEEISLVNANALLDEQGYNTAWKVQRTVTSDTTANFDGSPRPKFLVVGNSHAVDLYNLLEASPLAKDIDFGIVTTKAERGHLQITCVNRYLISGSEECPGQGTFEDLGEKLAAADTVILSARWAENDMVQLSSVIRRLRDEQGKNVIVVGNAFEMANPDEPLPIRKFVREEGRRPNETETAEIGKEIFARRDAEKLNPMNARIKRIAEAVGVPYIERESLYCDFSKKSCQVFSDDGYLLVWDYGHLSTKGAEYLGRTLPNSVQQVFRDALPK